MESAAGPSWYRLDAPPRGVDLHVGRVSLAAKLESAAGSGWYRLDAPADGVELPWIGETGVPVVEAMVETRHGPRPARFVIDTGVGETLLDPAIAAEADVDVFGEEAIHFPAGPAGRIGQGLLPRLTLAGLSVGNLPVHVHETRSSMAQLLPFPVDGVIGSGLLSRLPATLDYGRRRLQLGGDQSVERRHALLSGVRSIPARASADQRPSRHPAVPGHRHGRHRARAADVHRPSGERRGAGRRRGDRLRGAEHPVRHAHRLPFRQCRRP